MNNHEIGIIYDRHAFAVGGSRYKFRVQDWLNEFNSVWTSDCVECMWRGSGPILLLKKPEHEYFFSALGCYLLIERYNM